MMPPLEAALGASLFPDQIWAQRPSRRRYAIVGTGDRGSGMWGRDLVQRYVGCPTFTSIDEMLDWSRPDLLMVTTVDGFHHEYVIKGLDRGSTSGPRSR